MKKQMQASNEPKNALLGGLFVSSWDEKDEIELYIDALTEIGTGNNQNELQISTNIERHLE